MIRPLYRKDLPRVLFIEKAVHIAPWTEDTFKICFQAGYLGWVYEENETIQAFVIISATLNECHILNICVDLAHQRKGLGQKLMEHVIDFVKARNIKLIYLEVRRSNQRAISLYEKLDFYLIGERKNYYPTVSGQEDALILVKTL